MILDKKKLHINGNVCLTRKIEKKFREEKQKKKFENIFRKHLERICEFSCFLSTHANPIKIT